MSDKPENSAERAKVLVQLAAKMTHSFAMSVAFSLVSMAAAIVPLFFSDIDSWTIGIVALGAGGFFATGLVTERLLRQVLYLEISLARISMKVVLGKAKRQAETAKELALSLTYLGHLRKRHYTVKVSLLVCAATMGLLSAKYPNWDLLGLASMPIAFLGLIVLKELVIEYRIRHGFFGTSSSEARDLINFLIKNSSDIDFTDSSGKLRRVLLPETSNAVGDTHGAAPGQATAQ